MSRNVRVLRSDWPGSWSDWGYNGTPYAPMRETNVTVGTGWHPLKLVCTNALLQVYYHGTNVISVTDTETQWHTNGTMSLDIYQTTLSVDNITVRPLQ